MWLMLILYETLDDGNFLIDYVASDKSLIIIVETRRDETRLK